MEINFSKNTLYSAGVPIKQSKEYYEKWYDNISNFMYSCFGNEEVSFLSYYNPEKSIGDDFCSKSFKIKTFDNTLYYYYSCFLSKENTNLLVQDEEFYLGNIIVVKGSFDKDAAYILSLCWEKELITSDKEIFRMGNDGYYFYCYNIMSENFEKIFEKFIDTLKDNLLLEKNE